MGIIELEEDRIRTRDERNNRETGRVLFRGLSFSHPHAMLLQVKPN